MIYFFVNLRMDKLKRTDRAPKKIGFRKEAYSKPGANLRAPHMRCENINRFVYVKFASSEIEIRKAQMKFFKIHP